MTYVNFYSTLVPGLSQNLKESGGWTKCLCPFHDDRSPSATVDLVTGVFRCFVCFDGEYLSPEVFYSRLMNVSIQEASIVVSEFRRTHNILQHTDISAEVYIPTTRFSTLLAGKTIGRAVSEYAQKRSISLETCEKYGLVDDDRGNVAIPYWWNGRVCGIKYRTPEGKKFSEEGSYFSMFGIDLVEGIAEDETRPIAIICEGESDALCLASIMHDEPRVVVLGTSGIRFKPEWARELDHIDNILVVPQADAPSTKLVNLIHNAFHGRVKVHALEWRRGQLGKDVCDWVVWNNTQKLKSQCLSYFNSYTTPKRPILGRELAGFISEDEGTLIEGLLNRRESMIIVGEPKARKTFCALNVAKTLIDGGNLFGIPRFWCDGGYRVGLVEEEGSYSKLVRQRIEPIFSSSTSWQDSFWLTYKLGVKLTEARWMSFLNDWIERDQLDVLILDPLQNLHDGDENDVMEMGYFWGNISSLLIRHPKLSIIVLHHSSKMGGDSPEWNAIRGSSRHGAATDVAMFVHNTGYMKGKLHIKGRNIDHEDTEFDFTVRDGIFVANTSNLRAFEEHLKTVRETTIEECAKQLSSSVEDIAKLLRKSNVVSKIRRSNKIVYNGPPRSSE